MLATTRVKTEEEEQAEEKKALEAVQEASRATNHRAPTAADRGAGLEYQRFSGMIEHSETNQTFRVIREAGKQSRIQMCVCLACNGEPNMECLNPSCKKILFCETCTKRDTVKCTCGEKNFEKKNPAHSDDVGLVEEHSHNLRSGNREQLTAEARAKAAQEDQRIARALNSSRPRNTKQATIEEQDSGAIEQEEAAAQESSDDEEDDAIVPAKGPKKRQLEDEEDEEESTATRAADPSEFEPKNKRAREDEEENARDAEVRNKGETRRNFAADAAEARKKQQEDANAAQLATEAAATKKKPQGQKNKNARKRQNKKARKKQNKKAPSPKPAANTGACQTPPHQSDPDAFLDQTPSPRTQLLRGPQVTKAHDAYLDKKAAASSVARQADIGLMELDAIDARAGM
jgi:hypothetical protein